MGQFLEQVRADRIPGPLRRAFAPEGWAKAFAAAKARDETDRDIYDAALVVHSKLETIRSQLKLSSDAGVSAVAKVRAFVAAANQNFVVAKTKTREAFVDLAVQRQRQKGGFRPDEVMAAVKVELPDGFRWSMNEIAESLVDGIEVPIRFALQGAPSLAGNPRMSAIKWSEIALELNLGVMFRHAEDLWQDCLWNDYKVVKGKRTTAFIPRDENSKRGHAVGLARRASLSVGYTFLAKRTHRRLIQNGYVPHLREVLALRKEGKRQTIKIARAGEATESQEDLFVLRGFANEPYYSELLDEPLTSLGGATLGSVLDAWTVISRTASVLLAEIESTEVGQTDRDAPPHTWLPNFVPVIQVDALVQALKMAAGIDLSSGRRLIEFFTFRGAPGQAIWDSPLVPVGPKAVSPVFATVTSPNLRRLVDVWMRRAGIDLTRRGPAFEVHLRALVGNEIETSKRLDGRAAAVPDEYVFNPSDGPAEEIDLLFVIGSTVFVGEAKCILEPTEAKDIAMHRRTVLAAAEQAVRKSTSITNNRSDFARDVRRFGIELPQDFRVLPLVVVSTSTHVGVPANGVAVIDEYILAKFLEGELEDFAMHGDNLDIQRIRKTVFYEDSVDAEAKATEYFASPPQIQHLIHGLTRRLVPIYALSPSDWEGIALTLECVPRQVDERAPTVNIEKPGTASEAFGVN